MNGWRRLEKAQTLSKVRRIAIARLVQREPDYRLDGSRDKGGMNHIQAFIWNVRTYSFDDKRKATSKGLTRAKVSMQNIGAEQPVVVMNAL